VGSANMHELACGVTSNNGAFGPVRNPFDVTRVAGGSSGGSAAAVALGLSDVALGTDTGGSCRIPAAWCGVVGWRPTTGRLNGDGVVPLSRTRDTVGAFGRTVSSVALVDAVLSNDNAVPEVGPLRLGVPRRFFWEGLDPDVQWVCERALQRLRDHGVTLVDVDVADVATLDAESGFTIALYELARDLPRFLESIDVSVDAFTAAIGSPDVQGLVAHSFASPPSDADYRRAMNVVRPQLQQNFSAMFASAGVDAVVFPTVPVTAPPIGQDDEVSCNGVMLPLFPTVSRNTGPGSVAGIPGISLPCGFDDHGIPVGLELDGPAGSDRRLLALAAEVAAMVKPT
jgi:indoleacetamide hydrolase